MPFVVQRIPLGSIIFYFIAYLAIHIGIGFYREKIKKECIKNPSEENNNLYKTLNIGFKIFPALYVIFLLIIFY